MNQLTIINKNGKFVADSREVAEMTDVRHADLMRSISGYIHILENAKFRSQDFFIPSTYKVEGNNKTYDCYDLTRKGCDMVANKMTGEKGVLFTATYVTRFDEMEKQLVNGFKLPQNYLEALRALTESEEEKQRFAAENEALTLKTVEQQKKLREQETPVAIYHLALSAQNTMSMNEVAKSLGTGRTRLFRILREEGVIMRSMTIPYQKYIDAGYFAVRERPRPNGDAAINDPVTRVYAKGFDFIAKLMKKRSDRIASGLEKDA